jgi:hypothetical protein
LHGLNTFDDDNEVQPFDEQRERPQRRSPRRAKPTPGSHSALRLAGLVALGIAIAFGLVFWIDSCGSSSQSYTSYIDAMQPLAKSSANVGKEFANALGTPRLTMAGFQADLARWSQLEQNDYVAAQRLRPPGPLQSAHAQALAAFQLRYAGLQRLASTLSLAQQKRVRSAIVAGALANDAQNLSASDTVWDQLFRFPAKDILTAHGVTGVIVPASQIVTDSDIVSAAQLGTFYARFSAPPTGNGVSGTTHGSDLLYTNAVENGVTKQLSTTTQTTVTVGSGLVIDVVFKNSGDFTEVNIPVTLTVGAAGKGLSPQTKTVAQLAAGAQATVSFTNIQVPNTALSRNAFISVNIHKVRGEAKVDNNSATYPVFFQLAPS